MTKDWILATIDTNSQIWVSYQNSLTALNNQNNIYSYSKESIDKDIETAKLTLENAKNNKANIYSLSDNQLAISQKQLTNIQNNKSNTVLSNDENIKWSTLWVTLSEESLKVAQSNINNYEKNATESKKTLLDKKISIIRNIVSNIQNSWLFFM